MDESRHATQRAREAERVMRVVATMLEPVERHLRRVGTASFGRGLVYDADVIAEAIRALTFTPPPDGEERKE